MVWVKMKHKSDGSQHGFESPPKLLPTGSVDRILLVGGKNLTMFQSIGLLFFGLCFVSAGLICGVEFGFKGDAVYLLLFAAAITLWGAVMIVNGLRSIFGRLFRSKQVSP